MVYGKDKNGYYNPQIKAFTVSTGRKSSTPTRSGMYRIRAQYRWKTLMGPCYGQYSSSISESYLFHSVPYARKSVSSLYNSYYDNLGKDVSHGCIRMCVRDCKWIYDNCPVGTQVRVVTASGPAGDPVPKRKSGSKYSGWDPSDRWAAGNPYFMDGAEEKTIAAPAKPAANPVLYALNLQQNVGKTIRYGDRVTFSFKPEGNGFSYTWYVKKAGEQSWSVWKGRSRSSETVTPNETWNGIQVYCKAKDSAGKTVHSGVATILFSDVVTLLKQPAGATVKTGGNVRFSVTAVGAGLSWQWYFRKAGQTAWTVWNGRTRSSETVASNATWDGMEVYCAVRSGGGTVLNTSSVRITLSDALTITKQPVSVKVRTGSSAKTKASVSLKAAKSWNGAQFYCVVKDSSGRSVKSKAVKLSVKKK